MEIKLAAIGLGIGVLGAVLSILVPTFLASGPGGNQRPKTGVGLGLGLALTVVLFLATLPAMPPFSPGLRLGWGFLIGALSALLAAYGCARLGRPEGVYWPYPAGLALSSALAAMSLALLLFRGDPVTALAGCALGTVMVAGVFCLVYRGNAAGAVPHFVPDLEAGAALAVTLAAACGLAVHHFSHTNFRGWWAYPLALAGFFVLGRTVAYVAAAPRRLAGAPIWPFLITAAVSAALVLAIGAPLAAKLEPRQPVFLLLVTGLVTAGFIAWLGLAGRKNAIQAAGLSVVLVVFLVLPAFKALAGFGAAVALIAAWAVAGAALGLGGLTAPLAVQALAVGANFLLLRLFLTQSGTAVGDVEMALHYTLIGLMIGALLPFIYSSLAIRPGAGRALLLGALAALSPLVLIALWGPDAALGLLAGLVAAQAIGLVLLPLEEIGPQWARWRGPTGLLALGMALVAVQFSHALVFLYELPQAHKAYLAGGIAGAVVLWIIVTGLLAARRRVGAAPAAAPAQEG